MTKQQHLDHLVSLMAEPFREAWRAHCWHKAKLLAQRPDMADLPDLLKARMASVSTAEGQSTTMPKEPQG